LFGALDGLDLLEEESSDDSGFDASSAKNSTIGPRDSFVLFGEFLISVGSELSNTVDSLSAITGVVGSTRSMSSLLNVLNNNLGS